MMPGHGEWNVNGTTCHARRLLLDGDAVASRPGGRSRSIKFHNSPNDQNCSINLKAVLTNSAFN